MNENGGYVIAVAVLQTWKCNCHETGSSSPSDSSIDLKLIGNQPEYSLPSGWVMIKKRQGWAQTSPLTPELKETEETTQGSFLPVLHALMTYKRLHFAELTVRVSQSFSNAIYLISRKKKAWFIVKGEKSIEFSLAILPILSLPTLLAKI